jgi:DNA-binding LytR/AlgR family response regulator
MGRSLTAARSRVTALDEHRIAVRHGACVEVLRSDEILSVHATGNFVRIVVQAGVLRVNAPLRATLDCLCRFGVLRIHRSTAVNTARIRRVVGRGRHRVYVVLDTGSEMAVGRAYQSEVRKTIGAASVDGNHRDQHESNVSARSQP